jgi:sugar/nucleoside kinase (ribokinase family)
MDPVDVLVIGRSCVDFIAAVDGFPEENKKVPLVFRTVEGGGQGGTASCCIAKLGGRVIYVGKLGDDDEGRFCLKRLEAHQVDTGHIDIVKNGKTPIAFILVTRPSGNRTIVYERSSLPKINLDPLREKMAFHPRVILLDPEVTYLGPELRRFAGEAAKIVYDAERWREGIKDIMASADYFIPSADFMDAEALGLVRLSFAEKILALKKQVHGELIVTAGSQGACYLSDGRLFQVPVPAISVKDTTGAGDNFHAAFSLALSKGADIHEAVRFSVAVASLSCRAYGGRDGIPEYQEALRVAETLPVVRIKP